MSPDLSVDVGRVTLRNPVLTASGCFNYGREFAKLYALERLGGICVKGTSKEPWLGNPGTRVVETPAGMLNAIGLQNPGLDHFLQVDWPWLQEQRATVVVNIVGKSIEEYVAVAEALADSGVTAVELNISCPNVKEGGLAFSTNREATYAVTAAVRRATPLPLWVKLSPNVTNIVEFAVACEAAGADALTVANTMLGMAIDVRSQRPVLGNLFGGLSGPAVKPVILRMVWQVVGAVKIPVVAIGGISTWEDAVEYLLAGARAVQVGTACFVNPFAPLEIIDGLSRYLQEQGLGSVRQLVGAARPAGEAARGNLPAMGEGGPARGAVAEDLRRFLKESDRA